MKKMVMMCVVALAALGAFAADPLPEGGPYKETVEGIEWTFMVTNGEASVGTGSGKGTAVPTSTTGAVTIPAVLGGRTVTSIGTLAFVGCEGLTGVAMPPTVTSLGMSAFYGCEGLSDVTIPVAVTNIGEMAFVYCGELSSVTIPPGVTRIAAHTFGGCSGLTNVTISTGVQGIDDGAFNVCTSLKRVMIPTSVTSIGENAFCDCTYLTEVTIPSNVTKIGRYAFYGCKSLTSVTIPAGVTNVDDYAFGCCSGLQEVTILEGVSSIGDSSFSDCASMTNVTLPSSMVDIGGEAFSMCDSLTRITIPSSVTNIGACAFLNCSGLTAVTISPVVTSIGYGAFAGCDNLNAMDFEGAPPNGVADAIIKQDAAIRYNVAYEAQWLPVVTACGWTNAKPYNPVHTTSRVISVNKSNGTRGVATDPAGMVPLPANAWNNYTTVNQEYIDGVTWDGEQSVVLENNWSVRLVGNTGWWWGEDRAESILQYYIDDNVSNHAKMIFSNIPFANYDIYVYMAADTSAKFSPVSTIIDGTTTSYTCGSNGIAFEGNDGWGQSQRLKSAAGTNVIIIRNQSAANITIDGGTRGTTRGAIAAVQIVETVPPPTYMATFSTDVKWSELRWTPEKPAGGFEENAHLYVTNTIAAKLILDEDITSEEVRVINTDSVTLKIDRQDATYNVRVWDFYGAKGGVFVDTSSVDGNVLAKRASEHSPYHYWYFKGNIDGQIKATVLPSVPEGYKIRDELIGGIGARFVVTAPSSGSVGGAIETVAYWNRDFSNSTKGGYAVTLGEGAMLNPDGTVTLAQQVSGGKSTHGVEINFFNEAGETAFNGTEMTVVVRYSGLRLPNGRTSFLSAIWGDSPTNAEFVVSHKGDGRMYAERNVTATMGWVSDWWLNDVTTALPERGMMLVSLAGGATTSNGNGVRVGFAPLNEDGTYGDFVYYGFSRSAKEEGKKFYGIKVGGTIGPIGHFYRPGITVEAVAIITGYTSTIKTFRYLFPNEAYCFDWPGTGNLGTTASTLISGLSLATVTNGIYAAKTSSGSMDWQDAILMACQKKFSPATGEPTSFSLQYQTYDRQYVKVVDATVATSGSDVTIKKDGGHYRQHNDSDQYLGTDDTAGGWSGNSAYNIHDFSVYVPFTTTASISGIWNWSKIGWSGGDLKFDDIARLDVNGSTAVVFDKPDAVGAVQIVHPNAIVMFKILDVTNIPHTKNWDVSKLGSVVFDCSALPAGVTTTLMSGALVGVHNIDVDSSTIPQNTRLVVTSHEISLQALSTWTGAMHDNDIMNPGNWDGGFCPCEGGVFKNDVRLTADADWSTMTLPSLNGMSIDLNGQTLRVSFVGGTGTICDTTVDTRKPGLLVANVALGATWENSGVSFSGNLKFIKDGAGTFNSVRPNQLYTGGTVISNGTVNAYFPERFKCLGAENSDIEIEENGIFDNKGTYYWASHRIVLAGGILQNTGAQMISTRSDGFGDVLLTKDSELKLGYDVLFCDAETPRRVDMGGCALKVSCVDNLNDVDPTVYVRNTTFTNGVLILNDGVSLRFLDDFPGVSFMEGALRWKPGNDSFAFGGVLRAFERSTIERPLDYMDGARIVAATGTQLFIKGDTTGEGMLTCGDTVDDGDVIFLDVKPPAGIKGVYSIGYTVTINDCGKFKIPEGLSWSDFRLFNKNGTEVAITGHDDEYVYFEWQIIGEGCWWDYEFNQRGGENPVNTGRDNVSLVLDGIRDPIIKNKEYVTNDITGEISIRAAAYPYRSVNKWTDVLTVVTYGTSVRSTNAYVMCVGNKISGCLFLATGNDSARTLELCYSDRGNTPKVLGAFDVPASVDDRHLYILSVNSDLDGNTVVAINVDGRALCKYVHSGALAIGGGFQIAGIHGSDYGGRYRPTADDPAILDWVRVYDVELTDEAIRKYVEQCPSAPVAPQILPESGTTFGTSLTVSMSCESEDATVHYTLDGSEPTMESPAYSKKFRISSRTVAKAIAFREDGTASDMAVAEYAPGRCDDPVISPPDGTEFEHSGQSVSIRRTAEDGALRYTIDGSDPTAESPEYTGPFTIDESTVVKAKAFGDQYFDSNIVTATLTRVWVKLATPVITADETFTGTKNKVVMSCANEGATIYYTLDGSEPTTSSLVYSKPFCVTEGCTIKAKAVQYDYLDSKVAVKEITREWGIGQTMGKPDHSFETSGDAGFVRVVDETAALGESMQSGEIKNSQTSILSTVVVGPGKLSFKWKTSCEDDPPLHEWDHAEFVLDGDILEVLDGETEWQSVSCDIMGDGPHTVIWRYVKDGSEFEGEDCLWVSEYVWESDYTETQMTGVPVPYLWLEEKCSDVVDEFESYEKVAKQKALNKRLTVEQCYVAGLDPESTTNEFKMAILMEGGFPTVTWDPDLGVLREYKVWGKESLIGGDWVCPTNSLHRFFKVTVEMP